MVPNPAPANSGTSLSQPANGTHQPLETLVHLARIISRLACFLAGLAAAFAAMPAALSSTSPKGSWPLSWADPPLPRGWNRQAPLPAHALATAGMPGWQISLLAASATVVAAAAAAALLRPGQHGGAPPPAPPNPALAKT